MAVSRSEKPVDRDVYVAVTRDHGLGASELALLNDSLIKRFFGTALSVRSVKDITVRDRELTQEERRARIQSGDWLFFRLEGACLIDCFIGLKAIAFEFVDPTFSWIGSRELSREYFMPFMQSIATAFGDRTLIVSPGSIFDPSGAVVELVCGGLSVNEIIRRLAEDSELMPADEVEMWSFFALSPDARRRDAGRLFLAAHST